MEETRGVDQGDAATSASERLSVSLKLAFGSPAFAAAAPNAAHLALSRLERSGHVKGLITQNVDGLHQRAGNRRVIDLHGRLDIVDCQDCAARMTRAELQLLLLELNPFLEQQNPVSGTTHIPVDARR